MMDDCDDMETDERVYNIDSNNLNNTKLFQELAWFPDPLTHCIGFIAYETNINNKPQLEKA